MSGNKKLPVAPNEHTYYSRKLLLTTHQKHVVEPKSKSMK